MGDLRQEGERERMILEQGEESEWVTIWKGRLVMTERFQYKNKYRSIIS